MPLLLVPIAVRASLDSKANSRNGCDEPVLTPTNRLVCSGGMTVKSRGDTQGALIDAAFELVRRQGWAGTSVDQLCRHAGVTKGAFFHHFASKEALGVAAAKHWDLRTTPLFAGAAYHQHGDPLDRIFGYLDFRAEIAEGALEEFTCFVGTTVQETFATSEPIRAACGETIKAHAQRLAADFRQAIAKHKPRAAVSPENLALYTQTVLQGGFVMSKAIGNRSPLLDAISQLKVHLSLLFGKNQGKESIHGKARRKLHLV